MDKGDRKKLPYRNTGEIQGTSLSRDLGNLSFYLGSLVFGGHFVAYTSAHSI